jgi:hypothetical protein
MSGETQRAESAWTTDTLKTHLESQIQAAKELAHTENRGTRRALKLQATEYERRLTALNGENQRILSVQNSSVTAEKFEDYKTTQEAALKLALEQATGRLKALEDWRSRATGIGAVLVLVSGAVGAAIMRALTG